jgi:hypothetical protein
MEGILQKNLHRMIKLASVFPEITYDLSMETTKRKT